MTYDVPEKWVAAMSRARRDKLRAWRVAPNHYKVRSATDRTVRYDVYLSNGQVQWCSCKGWGGRQQPCKHAGAVARRVLRTIARQQHPRIEQVESFVPARRQVLR